jgi:NitT/TauT family transport system substrate-binding protein
LARPDLVPRAREAGMTSFVPKRTIRRAHRPVPFRAPSTSRLGQEISMPLIQNRRDFLASLSAAGATGVLNARPSLADEPPPETKTIRLLGDASICQAPFYIAEDLLRAEGFTDIRYMYPATSAWAAKKHGRLADVLSAPPDDAVARGEVDFDIFPPASIVSQLQAGQPITAVAGVHSGCYEVFAHDPIRTIGDLKGRSVGIRAFNSAGYLQVAIMAAHVGLDPLKDINWVTSSAVPPMELFADGQVDAFIAFPPEPQELRARKVGRVILNTATDKPWSDYLCCIVEVHRNFVRDYPICYQTLSARYPQSYRPLRGRAGARRATHGR